MSSRSGGPQDEPRPLVQHLSVPLHWLLACAVLALIVSDWPLGPLLKALDLHSSTAQFVARLVLLVLLLPLLWRAFRMNRKLYERLCAARPADESPLDSTFLRDAELIDRIWKVIAKYDPAVLTFFTNTLLFPRSNLVRVVEEAILHEQTLTLETSLTIDLTQTHPGATGDQESDQYKTSLASCPVLVVPIMRVKKGELIDNLDVESSSNASLPNLSQIDTKDLMAYIVANLFWRAYAGDHSAFNPKALAKDRFANGILNMLLSAVYDSGAMDPSALNVIEKLLRDSIGPDNRRLVDYILRNLDFLARYYVIAVEVPQPTGTHLIIKYRKSLPLYAQTDSFLDQWRLRLGLRPYKFTIPLWLPFVATSYHFRMTGPPGQYVMDHYLLEFVSGTANLMTQQDLREKRHKERASVPGTTEQIAGSAQGAAEESRTVPGPSLRVRDGRGLPYAHLYTGGFRFRRFFNLATVVKFGEIPPGALGGTTVIALVSAALIATFTLLGPPRRGASAQAILLATPTIAASVLGFATDHEGLLRSSLAARLGLVVSGLLSFAATLLYIAQSAGALIEPVWTVGLLGGSMHFRASLWWLLLSLLSLILAAHLSWMVSVRMHGYMNEVRAGDKIDNLAIEEPSIGESELDNRLRDAHSG
jgi:hypothetical protein